MKTLVPLVSLILAGHASAATIDQVSADGTTVSLRLSKEEQATLKLGDTIALQPRTSAKSPVEGKISQIKDGKATVTVKPSASRTAFRSGSKVNVASAGAMGPLTSSPKTTAAANPRPKPVPAASAEPAAFADGRAPTFENELTSFAFESPAQLYQARTTRSDAALGYDSASGTVDGGGIRTKYAVSGPRIEAAAVAALPHIPHRLSFAVSHFGADIKRKDSVSGAANTTSGAAGDTRFTPGGGYAVTDKVFAGAFFEIVQRSFEGGIYNDHELSISYARPALAALWHVPGLEAGLKFQTKVNETSRVTERVSVATVTTEARVREPAVLTAHGQMQVASTLAAYGSVALNANNANNVDGISSWKNNVALKGGAEKLLLGGIAAGGTLAVDTPAYARDTEKSVDNITTWTVGGDFSKAFGESGKVGAQLKYTIAADDYEDAAGTKIAVDRDGLALAITGTVKM